MPGPYTLHAAPAKPGAPASADAFVLTAAASSFSVTGQAVTLTYSNSSFPAAYTVDQGDSALVAGHDWQGLNDAALTALGLFTVPGGWTAPTIVADSTFVQCVDTSWPLSGPANIQHLKAAAGSAKTAWFWATYKWLNGYTSDGNGVGDASHKHQFFGWSGADGRQGWQYANTTAYHLDSNQTVGGVGKSIGTQMSGSPTSFGSTGTEWSDGEWYQFVVYYDVVHNVANGRANMAWFRRRLTSGGVISPGAWTMFGTTKDHRDGHTPASIGSIKLLLNRNLGIDDAFNIRLGPHAAESTDRFGLASEVTTLLGQQPRPTSTQSAGSWVRNTGGGTDLHNALNKTHQSDTDYVKVTYGSLETHTFKVRLASHNTPAAGDNTRHVIRCRAGRDSGTWTGTVTIKVLEGASTRSTDVMTVTIPASGFITEAFTLSTAEAATISSYSSLDIEVTIVSGVGDSGEFRVSFVPWEIPN